MADEPGPSSERKLVTVLFADLVGSTALASDRDPERVRATLDRFYAAMAAEIEAAGGTIEKFAGDAVMAAFGAPAALEDHAERALHAALAMQRRLRETFGGELALRIGVNTGEVVFGQSREGSSFVSGDVVNVAARLEQAASAGEILVGERAVSAVRGAFEFGGTRTAEAKGKPAGVVCRPLVRTLSLMRPRGVSGLNSAFVGRESELELLQAAYGKATADASPQLVTILGDAGVGKTRLVRELWQWLAAQEPQPLQRTGRCLPYGQIAYWALGEVLKEQLSILDGDTPESVRDRLGNREILGLALGLDVAGELHPLIARDRFQDAWVELFTELTAERPAAVLVEDLHWAEEPLLDLLEHVLERVHGPLLLLATARPEFHDKRPGFGRGAQETITLEPLELEATEQLITRLLGADPPAPLRDVAAQAEGNPFFLEEVLGSLIDQGLLEHRNGSWTMGELPTGFVLPDTVQAVVAARIDLLEPAEKEALQAASVIGRVFWSGPVYELCPGAAPDLRVLEERDFVRLRLGSSIEGEREYAMKHAVTREVAYASIPKARRAHLHATFAGWIESFGGGRDEHVSLLAHHLFEAARPEDADLAWEGEEAELERLRRGAIEWLRRAADLALGRYEIDEGISFLRRALELVPDRAVESSIWHEVGRANALKYDGEPFWAAMQRAIELNDDPAAIAEMYADLARETVGRVGMWRRVPETELVHGWIDRALELAPEGGPAQAKALLARALWGGSATDAAQASEVAERLDDAGLRSSALYARSLLAFGAGDYDEALGWAQRSFELRDEINDPDVAVDAVTAPTWPAVALGRFQEARRLASSVRDANASLTTHHRMHGIALPIEIEEMLGDWQAIRGLREDVEEAVEANYDTPCVRNARSLLLCALAEELAGDLKRARALEARADELRMEGHGLVLEGPRLRLALTRGDLDTVERLLAEDDRIVRPRVSAQLGRATIRLDGLAALRLRARVEAEAPRLLRVGTYLEPFALRALGIVREDESLIERAQECFRAMKLDWHAAQTDALVRGV